MPTSGERIIIDDDAVTLRYHPRTKIVHHEIRRSVHGEDFRTILEQGFAVFVAEGACKWLSDDRGNGPLSSADAERALNDWAPRMMAAGWRFWAVVMPEKAIGQMNMKLWIETYAAQGVTVSPFVEPNGAMRWLANQ